MKRIFYILLIIMALFLSFQSVASASDDIVESPDLKIEINGKVSAYSSVPIIVNGSTLLPLREILVNIGVQNDAEHILWNGEERSVTVSKDKTKVKLYVGNQTAYVNDKEITLSAVPVIYKDKTYIPARFVSQSLGMEVGWDGNLKKVFIKDIDEFNKVKDILDKVYIAMNGLERYKTNLKLDSIVKTNGQNAGMKMDATIMVDKKNLLAHYDMLFTIINPMLTNQVKVESYLDNNIMYIKDPVKLNWTSKIYSTEDAKKEWENISFKNNTQLLGTALSFDNTAKSDEIILKGNVTISEIDMDSLKNFNISEYKIEQIDVKIVINKSTLYINNITAKMIVAAGLTENVQLENVQIDLIQTNSDFNGNFEVTRPKDIR